MSYQSKINKIVYENLIFPFIKYNFAFVLEAGFIIFLVHYKMQAYLALLFSAMIINTGL